MQQPDSSASDGLSLPIEEVQRFLSGFRVTELQSLLIEFGTSRYGKKQELVAKACQLLKGKRSLAVAGKIQQLYRSRNPTEQLHEELLEMSRRGPASAAPYISLNNRPPEANRMAIPGLGPHSIPQNDPNFPATPDLKLVKLPYYDVVATLLRPTTLTPRSAQRAQENFFSFSLSSSQVVDTSYSDTAPLPRFEVLMRFAFLDTTVEQKDDFPSGIIVRLNEKLVSLPPTIPTNKPGVEPKRPSRPVNVTPYLRPSNNQPQRFSVSWNAEASKNWTVSVFYVKHVTSAILLQRLKDRGIQRADFTKALIKKKLAGDDSEIATTSLRVSLQCPLGKMRMSIPCKVRNCDHMQCFDGNLFLMMNEKKPTWVCPVCDKPAPFDEMITDGYFVDVLAQSDSDVSEIQVEESGEWVPMVRDDDNKAVLAPHKRRDAHPVAATVAAKPVWKQEVVSESKVILKNVAATPSLAPPGTSASAAAKPVAKEPVEDVIDLTEDSDEETIQTSGPPSTVSIHGDSHLSPDRSSAGSNGSAMNTPPIHSQMSNRSIKGQSSSSSGALPSSPAVIDLDSPPAASNRSPEDPVDRFISTVDTIPVSSRPRPQITSPPLPTAAKVDTGRVEDRGQKRSSDPQINLPAIKRFAANNYEMPTVTESRSTRLTSPRSAPPVNASPGGFKFTAAPAATSSASISSQYPNASGGHWEDHVSHHPSIVQSTPFPSQQNGMRNYAPSSSYYGAVPHRSQLNMSSTPAHQQSSMGNPYGLGQYRSMTFSVPPAPATGGPPPLRYGPPPTAHMRPEGFSQSTNSSHTAYMMGLFNQQMQQRNPTFSANLMGPANGTNRSVNNEFEPLQMELQKFMNGCLGPK